MRRAVENVLSGKNALSGAFNDKAVQFTADDDARFALAEACDTLSKDIRHSFNLRDDEALTVLITKLAVYCSKSGWKSSAEIAEGLDAVMPAIAVAINDNPDIVTSKAGIAGMIKAQENSAELAEAEFRKSVMNDRNAPPIDVLSTGDYMLVELLSPKHLIDESDMLGHCVGKDHNNEILRDHNIPECSPEAERYLTYAIKVRSKESRLFSLRDEKGRSCATIEYDVAKKSIKQIQGNPRAVPHDAPFMPDLCRAIYLLHDVIDLSGGVRDLNVPAWDVLITDRGFVEYSSDVRLGSVIYGEVSLKPDMTAEEVARLAKCSSLVLNIGHVDNEFLASRLPHNVCAKLYTEQEAPLELNYVFELKELFADKASKVKLPLLEKAEEIVVNRTNILYAPHLVEAEEISANAIEFLTLPSLKRAFSVSAEAAEKVRLPSAENIRDLQVWKAEDLEVPENGCQYINGQPSEYEVGYYRHSIL